jgi:hypothetical protein
LFLLRVCERFGKLPEEVLAADSTLIQLLAIERRYQGDG